MYRRDIGVIDDIEEIGEKKRYIYETFFEIQYCKSSGQTGVFQYNHLAHFYLVQYTDYYTHILAHLLLINTLVSATPE